MARKTPAPGSKPRKSGDAESGAAKTETQADIARRALAMKQEAEAKDDTPRPDKDDPDARHGMNPEPNEDQAPSGALDHGGQLPAMQRSRFAR